MSCKIINVKWLNRKIPHRNVITSIKFRQRMITIMITTLAFTTIHDIIRLLLACAAVASSAALNAQALLSLVDFDWLSVLLLFIRLEKWL